MVRGSFQAQVLHAREAAILTAVNRLLAEKGYDAMTVDEVAADVGIAKASLYKHFASKEDLAAAAMIRVLDQALAQTEALRADAGTAPIDRLKAMARWAMRVQLAGAMPSLPAQNSALRAAMVANRDYTDRLFRFSDELGEWITAAQASGDLNAALPPEVTLYSLFARACDPVLGVLKASGSYADEQIVDMLVSACFDGLSRGAAGARPSLDAGRDAQTTGATEARPLRRSGAAQAVSLKPR
jgi:AcrR family transcriptional regulator